MKQVIPAGYSGGPSTTVVNYSSFSGSQGVWTTSTEYTWCVVSTPGTISKLRIKLQNAPGSVASYTFVLMKNGSPTALSIVISGSNTTGADESNSVSVVAGDYIYLRCTPSGGPASTGWNGFVITFTPTNPNETCCFGGSGNGNLNTSTTQYILGINHTAGGDPTESYVRIIVPTSGTIKNMYVKLSGAPGAAGSGKAFIFTLRKSGVGDTALTVTILDTATTGSDTTHSVAVSAGDLIDVSITPVNTPASGIKGQVGLTFVSSTPGEAIVGVKWAYTSPSTSANNYNNFWRAGGAWGTLANEALFADLLNGCTLKKLYIGLTTAPGSGKNYIFTMRKNGADTLLAVTISNLNTTGNDSVNSVSASDGDTFDLESDPNSTPASTYVSGSFVLYSHDLPKPSGNVAVRALAGGII